MPRKTDEQDSTWALVGNYLMALLITGAIIAVDYITSKGWLDGALVGVLLTKVWDGITKQNEYFFPTKRDSPKSTQTETEGETTGERSNE